MLMETRPRLSRVGKLGVSARERLCRASHLAGGHGGMGLPWRVPGAAVWFRLKGGLRSAASSGPADSARIAGIKMECPSLGCALGPGVCCLRWLIPRRHQASGIILRLSWVRTVVPPVRAEGLKGIGEPEAAPSKSSGKQAAVPWGGKWPRRRCDERRCR